MLRNLLLPFVIALALAICASPALAEGGGGPVTLPTAAGCQVDPWGSLPREAPGMSPGKIVGVRISEGPCADRIVFDVEGDTPGWRVAYVKRITEDATGNLLSVPGSERLLLVIRANAHDIDTGEISLKRNLPQPLGFRLFRGLIFAGDFEGITTIGIGLDGRLPFRTFSLPGPQPGHNRVVIDVALRR